MPLPLSHVIGDSTPCRLRETGCAGGNVIGVILLALLVAGVVVSVLAWIWFRWERGPFPTIMRLLSMLRRR
jgi:hypothetical protein